ncbi:AEC family transporter [Aeromicrobium sp. CF4.19]|uniref:AEC family transporter n=1 Tax=Aeromicrobium sp. CF4.19 TaxID=3373082 RepID=UPI003EE7E902
MTGVLEGFATIGVLIALGALLAHLGLFDLTAQQVLSRLAFYVASPALLITVLQDTDVDSVISTNLVATGVAVLVAALLYVGAAVLVFRQPVAESTIGALCASYVNAGNLGLPIAAYVLGDAALVAPTLLLQMLVLQPIALTVLDLAVAEGRPTWRRVVARPFRTPLTVASLLGLALAVTDTTVPPPVEDPLTLIGAMAVPGMLLAYGISLRLGPRPGSGGGPAVLTTIVLLKLVVQPAVAYLVARFALGAQDETLLAVTVLAALPTAQNIFVHATRYGRGEVLARDAVFVTTVLSVPAVVVVTALLT